MPAHLDDEGLTPKQARFVDEYLKDLNATQAALRAEYSPTSAHAIATENMQKPAVVSALGQRMERRARRCRVKADRVVRELAVICFSDVTNYTVDDEGRLTLPEGADRALLRAVQSVTRKVRKNKDGSTETTVTLKLWPKVDALRLLARHLGMLPTNVEITGKDGGAIEVKATHERSAAERLAPYLDVIRGLLAGGSGGTAGQDSAPESVDSVATDGTASPVPRPS